MAEQRTLVTASCKSSDGSSASPEASAIDSSLMSFSTSKSIRSSRDWFPTPQHLRAFLAA